MGKEKEKETWAKIIEVYKELPYLWDKKHKDYLNRELRQEGFENLLQIHNEELNKEITLEEFKKKIENMRTTYTREFKKVTNSIQTDSGLDGVYIPTLWYYNLFDFLQQTNQPCRTGINYLDEITADVDPLQSRETTPDSQYNEIKASSNQCEEDDVPPTKKQRMTLQKNDVKILDCALKLLLQKEDEWEIIGKSIGLQMRDLSEKQRIIVQKIISDAIFYGKMGKLTEKSHISLEDIHAMPL